MRGWLARIALIAALFLNLVPGLPIVPTARAAAGAPLLILIDSATNPLSTYIQEILNAEGIKDYEVRPLSDLTGSALLTGRRAVILGESNPSAAQVAALDTFVGAGGGLIAMRPAASLDSILGVTRGSTTLTDGYVKITDPTYAAGLYADTMQFHGTSSRYTLAGASAIAELYSDRTAATSQPAVTLANRGAGKAALFSYDLARSVALTRQGNPANADTDTDGDGVIRSIDIFRGWIDLERTRVPQADMQQRLLVRLLQAVMAQPLPRLWYFPGTAPTVIVATGDAHANPSSYYQTEIDAMRQIGATMTFYLAPAGNPSPSELANWRALGFDFAPHPDVSCGYSCGFTNTFNWFTSTFGLTPRTVRTHQVRWQGWVDAAEVGAAHGVGLDFNSYQWGRWLTTASGAPALGYLSGSGQPMRFVDQAGNILPIYQQHTSLVDEELAPQIGNRGLSLNAALAASRQVIDESVGGYYTPITTQYHVDYFYPSISTWALETTQYALQQGAPSLTANSWLTFIEERAATTVTGSAWSGNTLTFSVAAGGPNQTLLLPAQYGGRTISGVSVGGTPRTFTTMTINGSAAAAITAQSGTYTVTYAQDTVAPSVVGTTPTDGASAVPTSTPISLTFSEAMDRTSAQAAFSLTPSVPGAFSWNATGTTLTFTPTTPLAASSGYTATMASSATDLAGNPLPQPTTWTFTTAASTPPPAVIGVNPVSGPTAGGNSVTISGSNFTGATAVMFGGIAATSFTVDGADRITATAPAHNGGTVDITVTTPFGTSAIVPADRYSFLQPNASLTLLAADPATGPAGGGAVVTLSGESFAVGATVTFGGVPATAVTLAGASSLSATTPAHAPGTVDIVVTNPGGQSATLPGGYTYVECPTTCLTQTTVVDFASGTTGAGSAIAQIGDGEVILSPTTGAEFTGNTLPNGWSAEPWGAGGGANVGNGQVSVDGALLGTSATFGPGRTIEFVATFNASAPYQHVGLGTDLNASPWIIFSTGSLGGALHARTNNGAGQTDTLLSGNWLDAPHRFRIEWTTSGAIFSIDGLQVATHTLATTSALRPVISDGAVGGGTLGVDWLRLGPYAPSGEFTSRIFDAAGQATWGTIAWGTTTPPGTGIAIAIRAGNTPTPDGSWSAFTPATNGAPSGLSGRYLQYRATLTTTAPEQTPSLRDLTIGYAVSGPLAPSPTSIAPTSGPTTGGTAITITGTNFVAGATVAVGGQAATNVVVASATQITATTPANAAGIVDVVVTNPDGGSGTLPASFTFTTSAPTISGLSPATGSTAGGTTVTLTGSGFVGATAVTFGATAATFAVTNDTTIVATAPAHAAGTVAVTVTTPAGTSPANANTDYTYQAVPPAPRIAEIAPGTGSAAGGAVITITGANLSGATAVSFGGTPASAFTVVSATTITATAPAHAAGVVDLQVTTAGGTSPLDPNARYVYVACPTACFTETSTAQFAAGTVGTGATIAQTGDGALTLAPAVAAEFGGTALPAGWSTAAWATGGGATVAGGQLAVDGALVGTTDYFAPGRTLEFTATFDPTAPYQHLGLGIDLSGGPWAIFSTGGSGGALYARSNGPAGTFDTLVPGNWLGAPHRFTITWTTTAVLYAIDGVAVVTHNPGNTGDMRPLASDGVLGGATLAVDWLRLGPYAATGTFTSAVLDAGGAATWGTVAWTGRTPANTTLVVSARSGNTPSPDGSWGAFAPLTDGGTVGSSGRYFQYQVELATTDSTQTPQLGDITVAYTVTGAAVPAIGSITPATGTDAGGTAVTISGSGFTGATAVTFGGVAATSFTVTNDTTITATTPAHPAGAVDVIVTTPVGASAPSSASRYTYVTPPPGAVAVTAVAPTSGATTGGTVVTITGANFAAGASVTFGSAAATAVTVNSATQITATTPAHAAGAVTIVVTNSDGRTGSLANGYSYVVQPPAVGSITPTTGPTGGGTAVTISGSGFTGATAVTFGGVAATSFTVTNDTTITATTPARAAGPVDVVVTTPAGASSTSAASQFTYTPPPPTVERIAPGTGPATGGTTVLVRGKHFTGATAVRFGGTDGSNLVVQSDTALTVVAPAGVAGAVDLRVVTPGGTSATGDGARFTYVACPDGCRAQSTAAAFGGGTVSNTYLAEGLDGEITLAPAFGAEFGGSALPAGMSVTPWSSGGTATVGDGRLTVDAALVASNGYLTPGRRIEFIATFDPTAPYQHIGLGHDLNNTPWAIFSTGSAGGQLYARTNTGGSSVDTPIPGDWLGAAHQFAIVWTTGAITYTIDGVQVASHTLGNTGDLRPVISDGALGGATLAVEWLRATPHADTGTYTSGVLDAGGRADWRAVAWTERVPGGTSLSLSVRSGDTATPDGSWTAFGPVANGGSATLTGRYIQYRATLTTTDPALTPSLDDITIGFALASVSAPTVTGLNPTSGPSTGGTAVTISGSGFTGATAVTFGSVAATSFTVTNDTAITATAPAHAAGQVDVVVTTAGGSSPTAPGGRYTYTAPPPSAPTVTSLSPTGGPAAGGTSVTITGTNFTGATAVSFGGTAATAFTVTSATTIAATAPAHAAGMVNVVITTPAGDSATGAESAYTYAQADAPAAPTVTGLSPTGGPAAGGTTVTISGTSFTGATAVAFGGTAASSFTVNSATSITAVAPPGSGAVDVVVTTPAGASPVTAASRYTYAVPPPSAPTITGVAPTSGPTAGGTAITITGTNFVAGATVAVGDQAATNVVVASATQITATTPANAAGAVAVAVTNPDGGSATLPNAFTYAAPAPTITSLSPTSGPTAGGTAITITGTNFVTGATVTVGGQPATAVTTTSATQITATTPAGTAGAASVVVTNPDGKTATAANAFTYAVPPTITGLSPTSGPTAGNTSVTVNGTGFVSGNTAVTFGGITGTSLSVSSATRLTVRTPAHPAGQASVIVSVRGIASAPATFTYVAPPTITDLTPNAGPLGGGTTVTITGTDFGGATAVTFGGVNATSYAVVNGTTITAVTPSRASTGTVTVRVVTPYGAANAPGNERFTYVAAPTITSLSPTSGPATGGTNVTINGTGFTGATAVSFGSVAATSFTIVSASRITARTPAQAAGAVTVSVTTPGGTSAGGAGARFTYSASAESSPLVASRATTLARTALIDRSRRTTTGRRRDGSTRG